MIKTIFEFRKPGGEVYVRVPAEDGKGAAIQSCTLTECVNSTEELTIGSACANSLEATLLLSGSDPDIAAGDEVIVYKQDGSNEPVQMGVFVLEKPTRATANTMKLTGYDYVSKLDKDLTGWLSGLTEWPYALNTFARMVCGACGLDFQSKAVPNGDFQVQQFTRTGVTGRQIMQWLGEICARFCRATPDGEIEFGWYTDSGKTITTGGELYYFQNALTYEDYETAKVDAVQLRLANSDNGALWPEAADNANSYIITGNAILNSQITEDLLPVLANIQASVARAVYTPCKVSLPANLDIRAGNTVKITDKNGKTITAYVMTKTQTGQKDTLECTGAKLRNGTAAVNNQSPQQVAQQAVASQTQKDIFDKLTNHGEMQGLYVQDGKLYINAELVKILNLIAETLVSVSGKNKLEASGAELSFTYGELPTITLHNDFEGYPLVSMHEYENGIRTYRCTLTPGSVTFGPEIGTLQLGVARDNRKPYLLLGEDAVFDGIMFLSWKDNGDGTYSLVGKRF